MTRLLFCRQPPVACRLQLELSSSRCSYSVRQHAVTQITRNSVETSHMQIRSILAAVGAVALAACSDVQPTAPATRRATSSLSQSAQTVGGVFVSTNGLNGNAVVAFARAADGTLTPTGTFTTGGTGIGGVGDPLASQFAVALS